MVARGTSPWRLLLCNDGDYVMATFKVAFNIWIDQESHPQIVDKKTAIAVAKSLTTNEVGGFDWDKESKGLLFKEYLTFETEASQDSQVFCDEIDEAKAKCECPEPEFSYVQKVRVKP